MVSAALKPEERSSTPSTTVAGLRTPSPSVSRVSTAYAVAIGANLSTTLPHDVLEIESAVGARW